MYTNKQFVTCLASRCRLSFNQSRNIQKWKTKNGADRPAILPSPLLTAPYVHQNLERLKLIDASWFMPADQRDPKAEYIKKHLPKAQFFDMDVVSDLSTSLPHMLPAMQQFAHAASQLGLKHDDPIVIYDSKGVFSAPRVWFTFKCYGAQDVAVMNGGLPMFEHRLLPIESGDVKKPSPMQWLPRNHTDTMVATYDEVVANAKLDFPQFQVLDARSPGRFSGSEPEPRAGLKSGHIRHSINVPYSSLVKTVADGVTVMKNERELRFVFEQAGVDLSDPNAKIVTTCGTGVTASVVGLALELLGHQNWAVYDGSWTEYGSKQDSVTG